MHLDTVDSAQFFRLTAALEAFALTLPNDLDIPGPVPRDAGEEMDVLAHIADNPDIVDRFMATTELPLSQDDLAVLRQWKHCWNSHFIALEYAPNGNLILSTDMGLVEVTGITHDIGENLGCDMPVFLSMTLMPFKERITYGVSIAEYPTHFGPNVRSLLPEWRAEGMAKGYVDTADEFIERLGPCKERAVAEALEEELRQAEREALKARGEEPLAPGFHRGMLAGLSEAERERMVRQQVVELARSYCSENEGDDLDFADFAGNDCAVDRDGSDTRRASNWQAADFPARLDHLAYLAAELYGIVSVADLAGFYNAAFPTSTPLSTDGAEGLLQEAVDDLLEFPADGYNLMRRGGSTYLVSVNIPSGEELEDASPEVQRAVNAFIDRVLDRQREIPLRDLTEFVELEDLADYVFSLPSAIVLRNWIDGHIPDGEDDLFLADRVIEDIYFETRGPVNPNLVPNLLADAGLISADLDQSNDLLALAMRFVNDLPTWENCGHSPATLHEMQTGRKIFYNEDGRLKKVGRNDPCPCGSGKKYKKCCGR